MEFSEAVRTRRMVRDYDPDRPVEADTLELLLNLANRAPSAGHTQGWRFLVLSDITSTTRFWSVASTGPPDEWRARMSQAPVLVVCFADRGAYVERYRKRDKTGRSPDSAADRNPARWPVPYWDVDTGMAALLLLLAAHDRGLAAAFFGVPASRWADLAAAFAVPEGLRPVGVVSIGHPAPHRQARAGRARRPLSEIVAYGSFA